MLGQRLALGTGPVPHRDVMTGLEQPADHRVAHPAGADPAEPRPVRNEIALVHRPKSLPREFLQSIAVRLYPGSGQRDLSTAGAALSIPGAPRGRRARPR